MKKVLFPALIVLIILGCFTSAFAADALLSYEDGDKAISLVDYEIYEQSGENYLVLFADFTCNSDNPASFLTTFSIDVFQNGVECETGYFLSFGLGDANTLREVKNGATVRVYEVKKLNDTTSDIEVRLGPWISLFGDNGITDIFPLDKSIRSTSQGQTASEETFIKTPSAIPADETKRSSPANIGDTVSLIANGTSYVELTLKKVVSGKEAAQIVEDANFFNASPEKDMEYCLAYFHVSMQASDEDKTFSIGENDFDVISSSGKVYEGYSHSVASLEDSATIYAGGSGDFVVPIYISKDDAPLLLYDKTAWFSIDDGTRANSIQARKEYLSDMPKDSFVLNGFLYIGMNVDNLQGYIKSVYDLDPISGDQTSGYIGLRYPKIIFDEFGCECEIVVLADAVDKKVGMIFVIHPEYSTKEFNIILSDYESIKKVYNKNLGQKGTDTESWTNKKDKSNYTQTEGLFKGLYIYKTFWERDIECIGVMINKELTDMGIVQDDNIRLWIEFYDPSFVKQIEESLQEKNSKK